MRVLRGGVGRGHEGQCVELECGGRRGGAGRSSALPRAAAARAACAPARPSSRPSHQAAAHSLLRCRVAFAPLSSHLRLAGDMHYVDGVMYQTGGYAAKGA